MKRYEKNEFISRTDPKNQKTLIKSNVNLRENWKLPSGRRRVCPENKLQCAVLPQNQPSIFFRSPSPSHTHLPHPTSLFCLHVPSPGIRACDKFMSRIARLLQYKQKARNLIMKCTVLFSVFVNTRKRSQFTNLRPSARSQRACSFGKRETNAVQNLLRHENIIFFLLILHYQVGELYALQEV